MPTYNLSPVEGRVLGVLIEKQMATPDYYPMTLNSLTAGCNQKTNRDPVMNLDEDAVVEALESLRSQHLVWQVKTQGSRVSKFEHNMQEVASFSTPELAILCLLLVRGAQTAGELRSRTGRLATFPGLEAVEHHLRRLQEHENGPFVVKLPRQPGHKESRYCHLLSEVSDQEPSPENGTEVKAPPVGGFDKAVIERLEDRVVSLEAELKALKQEFDDFRRQFD